MYGPPKAFCLPTLRACQTLVLCPLSQLSYCEAGNQGWATNKMIRKNVKKHRRLMLNSSQERREKTEWLMATTAHCPEICLTGNNKNTLQVFLVLLTKYVETVFVCLKSLFLDNLWLELFITEDKLVNQVSHLEHLDKYSKYCTAVIMIFFHVKYYISFLISIGVSLLINNFNMLLLLEIPSLDHCTNTDKHSYGFLDYRLTGQKKIINYQYFATSAAHFVLSSLIPFVWQPFQRANISKCRIWKVQ